MAETSVIYAVYICVQVYLVQDRHEHTSFQNFISKEVYFNSGMPMGSHNTELHFVVSLCGCSIRVMPKGAKTEAPKGLRERNMP